VTTKIFQRAAREVAHVDQGVVGKIVEPLDGALRSGTRRRDMVETGGASNVDPAPDRMNP
jgi:hypothetical protein